MLPLCTSATELHLQVNKISDRGAKALAAAFAEGAMLPKLVGLSWLAVLGNQIGDEGAMALAEAVGKGALPKLELAKRIGDEGAVRGGGWDLRNNKLSQTAKDAWEALKAKRSGLGFAQL